MQEFQRLVPFVSIDRGATVGEVLAYVANLHMKGLSAASIRTNLSAISFWHQLNAWYNPCVNFLVRKAVLGVSRVRPQVSVVRLPVSPHLLLKISSALPLLDLMPWEIVMFRAVFLLAFFAFLRVGEYTMSRHCLSVADVVVSESVAQITFSTFKHSDHRVRDIFLPAIDSPLCPVAALTLYLNRRSTVVGPLFVHQDNVPLQAREVRRLLHRTAKVLQLQQGSLTPHAFHIGAATTATSLGISDEVIARMGHWSSKVYLSYIHCSVNRM